MSTPTSTEIAKAFVSFYEDHLYCFSKTIGLGEQAWIFEPLTSLDYNGTLLSTVTGTKAPNPIFLR